MAYRLVKVSSLYSHFLNGYYQRNTGLGTTSYAYQHQHLMDEGYGYADFFPKYLRNNYRYEAVEIIQNATVLQNTWAKENNIAPGNDVLMAQLQVHQPEILFLQDSVNYTRGYLQKIKTEIKSLRLLIGHCCAPYTYDNLEAFKEYDFLLTCSKKFYDEYTRSGITCYLFPHAFEASLLDALTPTRKIHNEVILIGSLFYRSEYHKRRISYVEELLNRQLPLTVFGQTDRDDWKTLRAKQAAYWVVRAAKMLGLKSIYKGGKLYKVSLLNQMPEKSRIPQNVLKALRSDELYGKQMLQKLSEYLIGFNMHAEVAGDYAANVRMFEVTGVGSLLLTDHKKDISDLFEPDKEIITYKGRKDCVEKIQWLLNDTEACRQIAHEGQKRTLKDHTVERRTDLLHELIKAYL